MGTSNLACIRATHFPFRDLIYDQLGTLKIQVFNMHTEMFKPSRGEVHYFGDNFGDPLAFETIGYSGQSEGEIVSVIRWYSEWMGYPEMSILKQNPLT